MTTRASDRLFRAHARSWRHGSRNFPQFGDVWWGSCRKFLFFFCHIILFVWENNCQSDHLTKETWSSIQTLLPKGRLFYQKILMISKKMTTSTFLAWNAVFLKTLPIRVEWGGLHTTTLPYTNIQRICRSYMDLRRSYIIKCYPVRKKSNRLNHWKVSKKCRFRNRL